jgi:hypothetical protein
MTTWPNCGTDPDEDGGGEGLGPLADERPHPVAAANRSMQAKNAVTLLTARFNLKLDSV